MIQLSQIKTRIVRLEDLARKLGKEVVRRKAAGGPLLPRELRDYLNCIQDAIAGLDAARVALAAVVKRLEGKTGAGG